MIATERAVSDFGPEHTMLALLLQWQCGHTGKEDLLHFISGHALDQDKFMEMLSAHQMLEVFHSTGLASAVFVDQKKLHNFQETITRRAKFNLMILDELRIVHRALAEEGIDVLFYKGLFFSYLLYGDFTSRASSDIDILIKTRDFLRARNTMTSLGYEEVYKYPEAYHKYVQEISREALFRKQASGGRFIFVELQWAPLPKMFSVPYHNDNFFANPSKVSMMGTDFPVPALEQQFLLMLLHHGMSELWRKFRHMSDLLVFSHKYADLLDWKAIDEKISEWQIKRNSKAGVEACRELSGWQIPLCTTYQASEEDTRKIVGTLMHYPLLAKEKKSAQNISRQLLLSDSFSSRVSLLFGYFKTYASPSLKDLQRHNFPRYLFPLYYLTKRFRFLFK